MIYHIHIDKLITYPNPEAPGFAPGTRTLYGTINGVPVPINIPLDIPLTRQAVVAYLLTQQHEIIQAYYRNELRQPIENHDVDMDFDWEVP